MPSETIILEAAESVDGTKRWELVRRADGLFSYSEDNYVDLGEDGGGIDGYWTRSHFGLFDSAGAARHNAQKTLPWLSGLDAN